MNLEVVNLSILGAILPITSLIKNKMIKKSVFGIFIIFAIYIFGNRSRNTPDTSAYEYIFYNISSSDELIIRLEKLYRIFIQVCVYILKDFKIYLLILTGLLFLFWIKITKKIIGNIEIVFGTFYVTYGIYFFGITLSQAIAFIIAYYGISLLIENKNKKGMIMIIISALFHSSLWTYIIMIFFSKKKWNTKFLYGMLIASILFSFISLQLGFLINLIKLVLSKINLGHYIAYLIPNSGISLNTMYYTFFCFFFLYFKKFVNLKKEQYNFFINFYIFGVLILNFFNFFIGVSRLSDIFIIYFPILLGIVYLNIKKKLFKLMFLYFLIINNFLLLGISMKHLNGFFK